MIEKKTAVVTGAAKGLGLAVAKMLIKKDFAVVMADVDSKGLDRAISEIGGDIVPMVVDISDYQSVVNSFNALDGKISPISILINNAGIISFPKLSELSPEEWKRVLSINLDGAFYMCKQIAPGMQKQGWGRIINVLSLAMKVGGLYVGPAYCASKGGLGSFTFALAKDLAPFGITVNGVAPVHIPTPMIEENLDKFSENFNEQFLESVPVKRMCSLEEVVHVIEFLISPKSSFITGEIVDINGGLHMD